VLLNFFCFGFAFAGFCSLIGSFLNGSTIVSMSGMFYIVGVMVYALVFAEAVLSFYSEKQIGRLRVVLKASLLAAGSLNPIYLASVAIIADAILIIVEFQLRKSNLTCPKAWLLTNIFALTALVSYFFVPDSLLTLILVVAFTFCIVPVEIYMFCKEKNIPVDVLQNQPLSHTETTEADSNFWNLKAKGDIDKELMHSNERIEEKKEHDKEDFHEELERKRE
jgi:ABC-type multidrug transport system fused ATPase/permease subunit